MGQKKHPALIADTDIQVFHYLEFSLILQILGYEAHTQVIRRNAADVEKVLKWVKLTCIVLLRAPASSSQHTLIYEVLL